MGASSIKDIASYYGKHPDTIQNYYKNNRELFNAMVKYYVENKEAEL
jgi:AcrR family transcriptional regulator